MSIKENINYEDIIFKNKSGNYFGLSNIFFDESIMLYPLYKKIKLNEEDKTCDIFPYNDFRLELFCPILKDAIEEILIDKLEMNSAKKRRNELSKKIANL